MVNNRETRLRVSIAERQSVFAEIGAADKNSSAPVDDDRLAAAEGPRRANQAVALGMKTGSDGG
jgi:hypothetical protein